MSRLRRQRVGKKVILRRFQLKKVLTVLVALFVFQSGVFSEEVSAEELFNFATMGRPMLSNGFLRRAKEMSAYVAGIDEKNITYEYMRAIKKEQHAKICFIESAVFAGFGLGLIGAATALEDPSIMVTSISLYTLGVGGIIISGTAMQKSMLRKDLLIRRVPVALKQVSIKGNGANATWEFGRKDRRYWDDEIVFGF